MKMIHRIDILLTVMVLICAGFVVVKLIRLNDTIKQRSGALESKLVGRKMDVLKDGPTDVRKTLVLFLRPGCHFCEESYEFYRTLSKVAHDRKDVQLVVATDMPDDRSRAYVREANLGIDRVLSLTPASFGVQGTPTLLLLNERKVVVKSWVGKLAPTQEEEVKAALIGS